MNGEEKMYASRKQTGERERAVRKISGRGV